MKRLSGRAGSSELRQVTAFGMSSPCTRGSSSDPVGRPVDPASGEQQRFENRFGDAPWPCEWRVERSIVDNVAFPVSTPAGVPASSDTFRRSGRGQVSVWPQKGLWSPMEAK